MTKINWKIRLKNKSFWMTLVPALLLTAQRFADLAGVTFNFAEQQSELLAVINSVFVVLAVIGIVSDPTVEGFGDSHRALIADAPIDPEEVVEQVEQEQDTREMTVEEIVDEVLGK